MAFDPANIDDEKQYRVKLSKVIVLFGDTTLTPSTDNVIKGKLLKTLPVESVAEVVEAVAS